MHHFDVGDWGRDMFRRFMRVAGLEVEITGGMGRRTKFQTEAKAQFLVRATLSITTAANDARKKRPEGTETGVGG